MALVQKSVLVDHSAQRMYTLVDRVEDYPQFLPWEAYSNLKAMPK